MTDTLLHYLEWYITDGCLKAETDKGTYKIEQSRDGFNCTYQPYIENIAVESGFITDAIQACENHYGPKFINQN